MVNVNGVVSSPEKARISPLDRGFLFGDGIYETVRAEQNCLLFMEEHLERLRRSADKLAISIPWTDSQLITEVQKTAEAFGKPDFVFRLVVSRGEVFHVGISPFETKTPNFVIYVQTLPSDLTERRKTGISLGTSQIHRNSAKAQDPNIKTCNYLNSILALKDVKTRNPSFDDAILCNREGSVTEGTTFSVFGVNSSGSLITSHLEIGILDSITRRHVLSAAYHDSISVREGSFSVTDFYECKEVFIASSVRDIVPVHTWDHQKFDTGGPITIQLQKALHALALEYCKEKKIAERI